MTNSAALAKVPAENQIAPATLEKVVIGGDLSQLNSQQRTEYYLRTCESLGLNPLTRPFEYLRLNGKDILYARRDCTDQLRNVHNVSVKIVGRQEVGDVYVVTAQATLPTGRCDESTGAVPLGKLQGEAKANALMKAETKAKRRVTLSICGLSMLDETELEGVNHQAPPPISPHANFDGSEPTGDEETYLKLKAQLDDLERRTDEAGNFTKGPPANYEYVIRLREVLGSKAKPSPLCRDISAAQDKLSTEQRRELGKTWQRVSRRLEKAEKALQPDVSASFADEPGDTGELSEDEEERTFQP